MISRRHFFRAVAAVATVAVWPFKKVRAYVKPYTVGAVNFGGTNDYLQRGVDLEESIDQQGMVSYWINMKDGRTITFANNLGSGGWFTETRTDPQGNIVESRVIDRA